MPSLAQAISSLAALVAEAVVTHPAVFFLVGWAATQALYGLDVLSPLDWWGDREVPR